MHLRHPRPVVMAILAVTVTALSAAQGSAPQTRDRFRSEAAYVEISVVATDKERKPVTSLTRDDILITEEGQPQTIADWTLVALPARPIVRTAGPDGTTTVTNETTAGRRAFMIVIDMLHTSFTQRENVRKAIETFFARGFREGDVASIVLIGRSPRASVFTANPNVLRSVLRTSTMPGEPSSSGDDLGDVELSEAFAASQGVAASRMAEDSLQQLSTASRALAELTGARKTLVLFSEGIGVNLFASSAPQSRDASERVMRAERAFLEAASAADVSVYPIDVRGLAAVDPFSSGEPAAMGEWESLRLLADETGGTAFVGRRNMVPVFEAIDREASHYYTLGYYSTLPSSLTAHRIRVTSRRSGVTVRARAAYAAPARAETSAAATSAPLATARGLLNRALPVENLGLSLRATATIVERLPGGARFRVDVEPTTTRASSAPPPVARALHIGVGVFEPNGHQILERIAELPFQGRKISTTVDVMAPLAQLRIAVVDAKAGTGASVFLDLELPHDRKSKR